MTQGWVLPYHPGSLEEAILDGTSKPAFRTHSDFLSVFGGRAVLLPPLVGCGRRVVNYLERRPSLSPIVVCYRTSDTQTLAQSIASTGDRSFKDRAPDLLPTSVLEHHPLNGMLADFPFGFSPTPKYIIYFGS